MTPNHLLPCRVRRGFGGDKGLDLFDRHESLFRRVDLIKVLIDPGHAVVRLIAGQAPIAVGVRLFEALHELRPQLFDARRVE